MLDKKAFFHPPSHRTATMGMLPLEAKHFALYLYHNTTKHDLQAAEEPESLGSSPMD